MSHILLVEDDKLLGATLNERLEKMGHRIYWAQSRKQGSEFLQDRVLDLIILDVGLPDGSGFDFAKEVKSKMDVPIIFLTAQASAEDRLLGFELGAEEFIPKPFHLKELILRVRHVLEDHVSQRRLLFKGVEVDFDTRTITDEQGNTSFLSQKEYEVLWMLVEKAPVVVSRDEILDRAWSAEQNPSHRTVDNLVVSLRQALGAAGECIRSVRGVGYQWVTVEESNGKQ